MLQLWEPGYWVWPMHMPLPGAGSPSQSSRGMRSREIWLEVIEAAKLHYRPTGSLHLAYQDDESAVAAEFAEVAPGQGYQCEWLNKEQVLQRSAGVCPTHLRGGLWSPVEFTVDPRQVIAQLPIFLRERYAVQFLYDAPVRDIDPPLLDVDGTRWEAGNIIICGGDDSKTLYPELFRQSEITCCKLQMMRTVPQPNAWTLGPSLAAGLTFRFYPHSRSAQPSPSSRNESRVRCVTMTDV